MAPASTLRDFQLLTPTLLCVSRRASDYPTQTPQSSARGLVLTSLPESLGSFLRKLSFMLHIPPCWASHSHQAKETLLSLGSCRTGDKRFPRRRESISFPTPHHILSTGPGAGLRVFQAPQSPREKCSTLASCLPCPIQGSPVSV